MFYPETAPLSSLFFWSLTDKIYYVNFDHPQGWKTSAPRKRRREEKKPNTSARSFFTPLTLFTPRPSSIPLTINPFEIYPQEETPPETPNFEPTPARDRMGSRPTEDPRNREDPREKTPKECQRPAPPRTPYYLHPTPLTYSPSPLYPPSPSFNPSPLPLRRTPPGDRTGNPTDRRPPRPWPATIFGTLDANCGILLYTIYFETRLTCFHFIWHGHCIYTPKPSFFLERRNQNVRQGNRSA